MNKLKERLAAYGWYKANNTLVNQSRVLGLSLNVSKKLPSGVSPRQLAKTGRAARLVTLPTSTHIRFKDFAVDSNLIRALLNSAGIKFTPREITLIFNSKTDPILCKVLKTRGTFLIAPLIYTNGGEGQ